MPILNLDKTSFHNVGLPEKVIANEKLDPAAQLLKTFEKDISSVNRRLKNPKNRAVLNDPSSWNNRNETFQKTQQMKIEKKDKLFSEKNNDFYNKSSKKQNSWYFISHPFIMPTFTISSLTIFALCFIIPVLVLHGIYEIYALKKTVQIALKKTIPECEAEESQGKDNTVALMDEIVSLTEEAMIFSHLKKLSFEMKLIADLRDKAEELLTTEFLHLVAARIAEDSTLKKTLNLLQPQTLLKIGQMYQEKMAGKKESEKKSVNVNLDLYIDGTGALQLRNSEVSKSTC